MSDSKKTVQVLATYRWHEPIARICFTVKSSRSEETYNVCFSDGEQHGTCGCPAFVKAHRGCYHLDQLRPLAAQYFESRRQAEHQVAAPAPRRQESWSAESGDSEVQSLPSLHDYREKASLERGAFSILR